MTDALTRAFRAFASWEHAEERVPEAARRRSALLVAEPRMSRAALLLAAVSAAAQPGLRVAFFTHTPIQQLPACLHKCGPGPNPESLKKIKFCYPRTLEELLQQVAGLHESGSTSPTLIIVDRLEAYLCGPGGSRQAGPHPEHLTRAAHLSALLCDTAAFLTQRSSSCAPCELIASYLPEEGAGGQMHATDSVLDVLDRYFESRCTLTQDESYEAEAAGLQEVWHIYISGTKRFNEENCEDRKGVDQEWQLLISTDGLMEFKMV